MVQAFFVLMPLPPGEMGTGEPSEGMMAPGCPLMFLNFSLWGAFLPSPMLIHLSPSLLELQRICAICVFKIDFLIFFFFFYIYTQLFVIQCSHQHLRLNGPCNVQL